MLVIFLGVVDEDPKVIYQAHNARNSHTRSLQLIEGLGSILYTSLILPEARKARHSKFGRIEFPSLARLPHLNWAPLYIPSASDENLERDYSLVELGLNYHLSKLSLFNINRYSDAIAYQRYWTRWTKAVQEGRQDELWTFNTQSYWSTPFVTC